MKKLFKTKKLTITILFFGLFIVSFSLYPKYIFVSDFNKMGECSGAEKVQSYVTKTCEKDDIPLQGEISEETKIFKIEAKIPKIGQEKIDREIKDFVRKTISNFKRENPKLPIINGQTNGKKPPWKNELWISPKIYVYSKSIKSVRFDVYQFTGGAHGITNVFTRTFNLKTGKEITWGDLFQHEHNPLEIISPLARSDLKIMLGKMADDKWINEGTSEKNPENYKNWVVEKKGLRIIFSQYQVGPYAIGMPEVLVPWEKINSILKPPFLILK